MNKADPRRKTLTVVLITFNKGNLAAVHRTGIYLPYLKVGCHGSPTHASANLTLNPVDSEYVVA